MAQRNVDGDIYYDGELSVRIGSTTTQASAGGILYVNTTQYDAIVSVSPQTAYLYTVPANTLNTNGESVWYELIKYNTSVTDGSRSRILVNGVAVYTHNHAFGGDGYMYCSGRLIRTGATTVRHYLHTIGNTSGSNFYPHATYTGLTITLSSPFDIELELERTGASYFVRGETFIVGFNGA